MMAPLSPFVRRHLNVHGRYSFALPEPHEACGSYTTPTTNRIDPRIGRVVRSSSQRRQISLIWTTAQSIPRGLVAALNDDSGTASDSSWIEANIAGRGTRPATGLR